MFVVGLLFTQRSGSYFLDIFDSYAATLALISIALCEVLSVSYIYGMNRYVCFADCNLIFYHLSGEPVCEVEHIINIGEANSLPVNLKSN